jgi:VanZ family protein
MMKIPPVVPLVAMSIVLAYATLTPFNFLQPNLAEFAPGGGLVFRGYSTAYAVGPPAKLVGCDSMTIVLRLETAMGGGQGIVLDYASSDRTVNLRIEQWRNDLLFSVATTHSRRRTYLSLPDAMRPGKPFTAVMFYDGHALSGWRSLGTAQRTPLPAGSRLNWNPGASLSLGSSVNDKFDWNGTLYALTIFDRVLTVDDLMVSEPGPGSPAPLLSYEFTPGSGRAIPDRGKSPAADLTIPEHALGPRREMLASVSDYWHTGVDDSDVFLNILVFIPYGYVTALAVRNRVKGSFPSFLLAAALVIGISFSIEIAQHFLPTRNSSMMDVISNSIGAVTGIVLAGREWPRRLIASMGIELTPNSPLGPPSSQPD